MFDEFRTGVPLQAVYWKDLRPGLVFAGGLSINGYPPRELAREMTEEEYREQEEGFRRGFLELARAASGNQLVINVDDALGVEAVEVFDRWYGGLAN